MARVRCGELWGAKVTRRRTSWSAGWDLVERAIPGEGRRLSAKEGRSTAGIALSTKSQPAGRCRGVSYRGRTSRRIQMAVA